MDQKHQHNNQADDDPRQMPLYRCEHPLLPCIA
jgi:hypothetical protein